MSKTIGIVELYQHNEVLAHYCKLLLLSDHQIYVFCNEKVFSQLAKEITDSRIVWHINKDETTIKSFLCDQQGHLKKCSKLIVTSIFSNFKAFNKLFNLVPSVLIVHSAHTWFKPFKHIRLRPSQIVSDFLRLCKFVLTRQRKWRHRILKSSYKIALPNQRIYNFVKQFVATEYKTKLTFLPFGAYEGFVKRAYESNTVHLVIPGTLSPEVRNYHVVIDTIKKIKAKLKTSIKLSLLGNANNDYGQQVVSQLNPLQDEYFSLQYWNGFIEQKTYDQVISEADYLLLPLKKFTQFSIFREKTCESKLSGSVNDMIRFAKTTIASPYLMVDNKIDQAVIRFHSSDDLSKVLLNISKPTNLDENTFDHYRYSVLLKDFKHQIDL